MALRFDPGIVTIWVTLPVPGSIRTAVAPIALATQIDPPPLTTVPGAAPAGNRSTTAPEPGATRRTDPLPGSATHREPAPLATAPTGASSGAAATSRPEPVSMLTRPGAAPRVGLCGAAAPAVRTTAVASAAHRPTAASAACRPRRGG